MSRVAQIENDIFAEVLNKIQSLSSSQQRFIHEMLAGSRSRRPAARKTLLKRSFGIWADRADIKDSVDYVNDLRKEWKARAERITG
jgi:hypothetical protein